MFCVLPNITSDLSPCYHSLVDGNLVPRVSSLHVPGKRRDPGNIKVGSKNDDDDDDDDEHLGYKVLASCFQQNIRQSHNKSNLTNIFPAIECRWNNQARLSAQHTEQASPFAFVWSLK